MLRARELPPIGGDTLWADAAAAYEGLSDEVKARIEGRTATHDLLFDFDDRIAPERRAAMAAEFPPRHHPVVRWVPPEEFGRWHDEALSLGFAGVMAGPLVRSSYRAGRLYAEAMARRPG